MFSENIVQARLKDAGNYEVNLKPAAHLKGEEHELMAQREGGRKSNHQKQRSRRDMKNRDKEEPNVNMLRLHLLLFICGLLHQYTSSSSSSPPLTSTFSEGDIFASAYT